MVSSKRSEYLPGTSGSTPEPDIASARPNPRLEQSSGEQMPQQPALLGQNRGRRSRVFNKLAWRSMFPSPSPPPCRSPSPSIERGDGIKSDRPIAMSTPQSLIVPASAAARPSSSDSTIKAHDPSPLSSRDNVSTMSAAGLPQTEPTQGPNTMSSSSHSSRVWANALKIAEQKLSDNNLPPLDVTHLNSDSAEGNIVSVIDVLKTLQGGEKKKRWRYTWRGKEIMVVERLGEVLKSVDKYSKIVDTAIQSNPQVSALVWAGIWGIMRVTLNHIEVIEGLEVAIAVLLEKMAICEFYAGIYAALSSRSAANSLQLQSSLNSALPELYAAVIVFSVKARTYFEAAGMKKFAITLKSFDIEFQPFIEEINAKEVVIRQCADAATMDRIRNIEGVLEDIISVLKPLAILNDISATATHTLNVELLTMLTPLEPLKRHQDVKLPRTKNSGKWLLELESFCKWQNSSHTAQKGDRVFCCYGIPGAGKTVISSVVIDHLYSQFHEQPKIGIACLYADYKDQANQILGHILGSFLHQLLTTAREPIPGEIIQKLQDIQLRRGKLGTEDNLALLKIRLQQLDCAFICIDALDELEPKVRQQLLAVLKDLGTNNTRLFLTGRGHIESEVQKCLQVSPGYTGTVTISASHQDIQQFLRQQLEEDHDLNPEAMDEVLAKEIIDKIVKKSQGMFLLPSLHIKMVLEMPTRSKRREALETLPTDLYDAFQGIITRIQECRRAGQAELGMRVLMWLHFAHQPLTLAELQHALAVEKNHAEFDAGNIPPQKALLDSCLGLVVVDEGTLSVRFVHYTLEEYFHKDSRAEFHHGYTYIAETCLTYLNFGQLKQHYTSPDSLEEKMNEYVFLKYAARHWGTYVKQQCNDNLMKLAKSIVDHEIERPPCAIQALYYELERSERRIAKKFSGIHVTAYFGLDEIMAYFCKLGKFLELKDETGQTPLSWAAACGHQTTVQLLIQRDDIDINTKDKHGWTPLLWAAVSGHDAVVRLLVERDDVDSNSKNTADQTALSLAVSNGHEAVVRLLVGSGETDINTVDGYGWTPLSVAAVKGREAIVRLLVERSDVNINSKNYGHTNRQTPLSLAATNGHESIVRLLVERGGVDFNSKDLFGHTAFSVAAQMGHTAIVQLLVGRDEVDINSKDDDGQTPLSMATENGHEAVVRLLVERGRLDINSKDIYGYTALSIAARMGQEAIVRLLVGRDDIDINTKSKSGKTPLSWATKNRHWPVVQLLKDRRDCHDMGGARGSDTAPAGSFVGGVVEDIGGGSSAG